MLSKLSKKITSLFIKNKIIEESKREVYDYCFEILLSTLINGFAILIIALITGTYIESLLYIASFMLLRSVAGGYHANTHVGCFITLMIFFGAFISMLKLLSNNVLLWVSIAFAVINLITVFLFAPVDSPNNPMSEKKRDKYSRLSIILTAILTVVSLLLLLLPDSNFSFCILAGMASVSVSLVMAKTRFKFVYEYLHGKRD